MVYGLKGKSSWYEGSERYALEPGCSEDLQLSELLATVFVVDDNLFDETPLERKNYFLANNNSRMVNFFYRQVATDITNLGYKRSKSDLQEDKWTTLATEP